MPTGKYLKYLIEAIFIILLILKIVEFTYTLPLQSDTLRHISTAKILKYPPIFNKDPFSFNVPNRYINYEFLSQKVFYIFYRWGNLFSLNILKLCILLTITLLIYLSYPLKTQIIFIKWAVIFLSLEVIGVFSVLRPHIFSMLFFTLIIYLSNRWKENYLVSIFVPFLIILWAHFHIMFILGSAIFIIYFLPKTKHKRISLLTMIILAELFLTTSYGCNLFWEVLDILKNVHLSYPVHKLNSEFFPFWMFRGKYIYSWYLSVFIGIFFICKYFKHIDLSDKVLFLFLFAFSFTGARSTKYLSIFLPFLLKKPITFLKRNSSILLNIFSIAIIIFCTHSILNSHNLRKIFYQIKTQKNIEEMFEFKGARFLKSKNIKGNFFTSYNGGDILEFFTYPNIKVSIDSRGDYFLRNGFYMANKIIFQGNWKLFKKIDQMYNLNVYLKISDRFVLKAVVFIKSLMQDPQWHLVYFDADSSIWLKDTPQNRKIIKHYKIDLKNINLPDLKNVPPEKQEEFYIKRATFLNICGALQKSWEQTEKASKINPKDAEIYHLQGQILMKKNMFKEALKKLYHAEKLAPYDERIQNNLGVCLVNLHKFEEAKRHFEKALKIKPNYKIAKMNLKELLSLYRK